MSEWDEDDLSSGKGNKTSLNAGPWDWIQTLSVFIVVTAVSFLAAYITKDIESRPFWMLSLCVALPVAALMLTSWLKEKMFPTMTPSSSRKAQLGLVMACIVAAGIVGGFCQVSNKEATSIETVRVGNTMGDVLIILDKSGSMGGARDQAATKAVVDLVTMMDDSVQVGLLIDVGWAEDNDYPYIVPLSERKLDIAPLAQQRDRIIQMARCSTGNNEYFTMAFKTACGMIREYTGEPGNLSIIILSDGEDWNGDFRASAFAGELNGSSVKVNYLYVNSNPSGEMLKLCTETGGQSVYAANLDELTGSMNQFISVPVFTTVYKDALRSINDSPTAKTVTGLLLLLLGILIGVTLSVLYSVQGQKRFQMILSPLMAAASFLILVFGNSLIPSPWIREAVAFSLFGIVFMRANSSTLTLTRGSKPAVVPEADGSGDDSW